MNLTYLFVHIQPKELYTFESSSESPNRKTQDVLKRDTKIDLGNWNGETHFSRRPRWIMQYGGGAEYFAFTHNITNFSHHPRVWFIIEKNWIEKPTGPFVHHCPAPNFSTELKFSLELLELLEKKFRLHPTHLTFRFDRRTLR